MASLVLTAATLGGTTAITPTDQAGVVNITLPSTGGTLQTSGAGFTTNGVAYATSTSALATGSSLVWTGTNLGIGTSSPAQKLHVNVASGSVYQQISSGSNNFYLGVDTSRVASVIQSNNALIFDVGSSYTQRMVIDTSGNVGIGTTNPSYPLVVNGSTNPVFAVTTSTIQAFVQADNNTSGAKFGSLTNHSILFMVNNGESARIDTSGNLLVGKTYQSVGANGFEALSSGYISSTASGSTSSYSTLNVYSSGVGAYRFYVDMAGTVHATSVVITAISDQRLKENVRDIDTGLDSIMALKPRRFDWKEGKGQNKKNVAGFIAQEFENVFPECVGLSKTGADGIEYKNINHETLIPTLVKAIQEQQTIIESLTARLTALENK